jgi:cytochrome c oxidase cbb3-type subunit III
MCFPCRDSSGIAATIRWLVLTICLVAFISCEREKREIHPPLGPGESNQPLQITPLNAGGALQPPQTHLAYEENAYAMSEGKELYTNFNCSTCHAHGGGDIGPPLKDEKWIYGSDPVQIYASIVEGRPNGMPAFRARITDQQVWQIVAYIRSMGGLASSVAAPGRSDHISDSPPENSVDKKPPQDSSLPRGAETTR